MLGNELLQLMSQAKALGKFGLGPYGSAIGTLAGAPEAFSVRDKKAYPMHLSSKDRQATIKGAMDARYSAQPPEPDWMKSWSGVGSAAKDLGGRMNYDPNKPFPFSVNPPPGPPMAPPGPQGPPPPVMPPGPPPMAQPAAGPPGSPQGQGPWWMQAANGMSPGVSQGLRGPPPGPPQPPQGPPMAQPAAGPPMSLAPPNPGPMAPPTSPGNGFNFFGPVGKGLDGAVNDSAALVKKFYQDTFGQ